jgi:hypothetical protein
VQAFVADRPVKLSTTRHFAFVYLSRCSAHVNEFVTLRARMIRKKCMWAARKLPLPTFHNH